MNRAKKLIRMVEEDQPDLFQAVPQDIPDLTKAIESLEKYGFMSYGEPYSNPVAYFVYYKKGSHKIHITAYKEKKDINWVYSWAGKDKQSGNDAESLNKLLGGMK